MATVSPCVFCNLYARDLRFVNRRLVRSLSHIYERSLYLDWLQSPCQFNEFPSLTMMRSCDVIFLSRDNCAAIFNPILQTYQPGKNPPKMHLKIASTANKLSTPWILQSKQVWVKLFFLSCVKTVPTSNQALMYMKTNIAMHRKPKKTSLVERFQSIPSPIPFLSS